MEMCSLPPITKPLRIKWEPPPPPPPPMLLLVLLLCRDWEDQCYMMVNIYGVTGGMGGGLFTNGEGERRVGQ